MSLANKLFGGLGVPTITLAGIPAKVEAIDFQPAVGQAEITVRLQDGRAVSLTVATANFQMKEG